MLARRVIWRVGGENVLEIAVFDVACVVRDGLHAVKVGVRFVKVKVAKGYFKRLFGRFGESFVLVRAGAINGIVVLFEGADELFLESRDNVLVLIIPGMFSLLSWIAWTFR